MKYEANKDLQLMTGIHSATLSNETPKQYTFYEIGIHKSKTLRDEHHASGDTRGFSLEFAYDNRLITGFKYSYWGSAIAMTLGYTATLYTDYRYTALKLRPEIGVGYWKGKLSIGVGIPLFHNPNFDLTNFDFCASFNASFRLKRLYSFKGTWEEYRMLRHWGL